MILTSKKALLFVFTISFTFTKAQPDFLTQEKSKTIIQRAVELQEEEKYDEALSALKSIHRNDSNYYLASIKILGNYYAQKNYTLGLELCDHLLKLKNDYTPNILLYKGSFLERLNKPEDARKIYEQGAKDYPLNNSFYFELGVSKMNQKEYDEAYAYFIRSAKLNPFHAASHQKIGILAYRNKNITATMLALQFYFVCDNSSKRAKSLIGDLEKIVKLELEADTILPVKAFESENDFNEIESVLKSKVALTSKYKLKTDLTFDLVKQIQIVIENIGKYRDVKGFYNDFYGQFFTELQKASLFEPFLYSCLSGMELEKVDKWVQKHKAEIEKYEVWAYNYICEKMAVYPENLNGELVKVPHWFSQNQIAAAGLKNAQQNNEGYWNYYYRNGIKRSEGEFKNGDRNKTWNFYYITGGLKEKITYENGSEKFYKSFYENNNPKVEFPLVNDKITGIRKVYFSNGYLASEAEYKDGEVNGTQTYYYRNGTTRYSINNIKGIISGSLTEYFDNGRIYQKALFVDGKREGVGKTYFNNAENSIATEANYVKNKYTGEVKSYYRIGKLYKTEAFDQEGNLEGLVKEYYDNGKLSMEASYSNNRLNGLTKNYNDEGTLWEELLYKKGKLIGYKAYKKDGTLICDNKINGKNYSVVLYHPNGNKRREGKVSDGELDGVWKDYNSFGVLINETNYKESLFHGQHLEYHRNGKVKRERTYVNGNEIGYSKSFYPNGNVENEGMVVDGNNEGYWKSYYIDGTLKNKYYYVEGSIDGWYEYYDVLGKLSSEDLYQDGCLVKIVYHDTAGVVIQNLDFPGGTGLIERKNMNGATLYKSQFLKNNTDGLSTSYHIDGKIESQVEYKKGNKEGKELVYNNFGVLTRETNFFNNEINGHKIGYDYTGKKESDFVYENGDLNGKCFTYHTNGKVYREINYDYGDTEGESNVFDETGELIYSRNFHKDLLVSYTYNDLTGKLLKPMELDKGDVQLKCNFKNGKKSFEATYSNGDLNGKRLIYSSTGKLLDETNFYYDIQHGISKDFHLNGALKDLENYYYGKLEGKYESYYDNGKLRFEGAFKNGEEHGLFKYYDVTGKLVKSILFYSGSPVVAK